MKFKATLLIAVMFTGAAYGEVKIPSYVTAEVKAVCTSEVKRVCKHQQASFDQITHCVRAKWNSINMNCKTAIVSLLPELQKRGLIPKQ